MNHVLTFSLHPFDHRFTYHIDYGDGHKQVARSRNRHSYHRPGNFQLTVIVLYGRDTVDHNQFALHIRPMVSVSAQRPTNYSSPGNPVMPRTDDPDNQHEVRIVDHGNWDKEQRGRNLAPLLAAEQMPSYPGGDVALQRFLARNVEYPPEARNLGIEGKVVVKFVVQADGRLTNLNIVKELGHGCDVAVLHALARMPRWVPGKNQGQVVPVYYTLPVTFKLM